MMWRVRMRYGLRWRDTRPGWRELRRVFDVLIVCAAWVALYAVVDLVDRLGDAMAYADTFRECMSAGANGMHGGFYFPDTRAAFECVIRPL